jgi:hypothetical protein
MNVLMVLKVLNLNLRDCPSVAKPTLHGHEADAGTRRTGEPAVRLHVGSFHHLELARPSSTLLEATFNAQHAVIDDCEGSDIRPCRCLIVAYATWRGNQIVKRTFFLQIRIAARRLLQFLILTMAITKIHARQVRTIYLRQ